MQISCFTFMEALKISQCEEQGSPWVNCESCDTASRILRTFESGHLKYDQHTINKICLYLRNRDSDDIIKKELCNIELMRI